MSNPLVTIIASITLLVGLNNLPTDKKTGEATKKAKSKKETTISTTPEELKKEQEKFAAKIIDQKGDTTTYLPIFVAKKIAY